MSFEKLQAEAKRNLMPMTQHWYITRHFRDVFDAMFKPFVDMTKTFSDSTKVVADALQHKVFFSEAGK